MRKLSKSNWQQLGKQTKKATEKEINKTNRRKINI